MNHLLKNDPVVIAQQAEIDALKYENKRLRYLLEALEVPRGLSTFNNKVDEIDLTNVPEKLVLPLTIESQLVRDGCLGWNMMVRCNKSYGDFRYGFYTSEPELLGSGDIVGVAGALIEKSMIDLAHFYRKK